MKWNILHVRRGVRCSSCDGIFISCHSKYSFIHRKSVLWHKMFFFIPVTGNKFPVTRMIFLVRENRFLMNFWSSFRCITFLRQMCGIYNQNFVWDLKILWEPGSHLWSRLLDSVVSVYMWTRLTEGNFYGCKQLDSAHFQPHHLTSAVQFCVLLNLYQSLSRAEVTWDEVSGVYIWTQPVYIP